MRFEEAVCERERRRERERGVSEADPDRRLLAREVDLALEPELD